MPSLYHVNNLMFFRTNHRQINHKDYSTIKEDTPDEDALNKYHHLYDLTYNMGDYGSAGNENLGGGNGWNSMNGPGHILPVESIPSGTIENVDSLSQPASETGVHYSVNQNNDYRVGPIPFQVPQPQNPLTSMIPRPPITNTQPPLNISPVQNTIPSFRQQIKVPTSIIKNFNLRRIGILALIKLGLIKLKAIGFLKILLFLLLKLKLFLTAVFIKYQLFLKFITFFKTLMLPLFFLPVLPILISLIYPMVVSSSNTEPILNIMNMTTSSISTVLNDIFSYDNRVFQESIPSSEVTYTLIPGETILVPAGSTLVPGSTLPALSPGQNNGSPFISPGIEDAYNILIGLPRTRNIKMMNEH